MKYVVGFTDEKSGSYRFRGYEYKNDALEFIEIHKKKKLSAQLYEATKLPQVEKPKVNSDVCPVCRSEVDSLTIAGYCKTCAITMDGA